MLKDKAIDDPLPRGAMMFRRLFCVIFLFSQDIEQTKTTTDRRETDSFAKDGRKYNGVWRYK